MGGRQYSAAIVDLEPPLYRGEWMVIVQVLCDERAKVFLKQLTVELSGMR